MNKEIEGSNIINTNKNFIKISSYVIDKQGKLVTLFSSEKFKMNTINININYISSITDVELGVFEVESSSMYKRIKIFRITMTNGQTFICPAENFKKFENIKS